MTQTEDEERDFKIGLSATRVHNTGDLIVSLTVIRSTLAQPDRHPVIEDVTHDFEHLNADVGVFKIGFDGIGKPWRISSQRCTIDGGATFNYVVVMYGPPSGPLKLVAVKSVE